MVDRYKVVVGNVTATAHGAAHPEGEYVLWRDYEALRDEVDAHKRSRQIDANEARSREQELRAEVELLKVDLDETIKDSHKQLAEVERLKPLRGDLQTVSDVLRDFPGETAWQQAQAAVAEVERLRAALASIAANTCCGSCQEAALVAQAAIRCSSPTTGSR